MMTTRTDTQTSIDEKIKQVENKPKKYNVIMLNDDLTPMVWVISILKEIFKHSDASAEALTMSIHTEGSAVVGTYSYEIAEEKAIETTKLSRGNGFPLQVTISEGEND
jgi:ATP-dependent Clp protease adaptor protein ClpS